MPLLPLGQCLLPFFELATLRTVDPFDLDPWLSPTFRRTLGLVPVPPKDDDQDDASYRNVVQETVRRGFALREDVTIGKKRVKNVNEDALRRANLCMHEALRHVQEALRKKTEVKGAWKLVMKSQNFKAYNQVVLALLQRAGGPWSLTADAMRSENALPAHAWMLERAGQRVSSVVLSSACAYSYVPARRQSKLERDQENSDEYAYQDVKVPAPGDFVKNPSLRTSVASAVFGPSGLIPEMRHVSPPYADSVSCLLGRVWESLSRILANKKNASKNRMHEFDAAFKEACDAPTPANIKAASRLFGKWRKTAAETLEINDKPFKQRFESFEALWRRLGYTESPDGTGQ
ncbi:hypothetical protein FRC07_012768 [Ceratobasidium sp. 392]|nr:hypothetical protein FRC07_012768 [Ceratobasidium sp. 392]